MIGLLTSDGNRTIDAITFFLSTLHSNFGPHALVLELPDTFGIALPNGWATTALLQWHNQHAVLANHHFLVQASAGVAWADFTAAFKEDVIHLSALTRLKRDWE